MKSGLIKLLLIYILAITSNSYGQNYKEVLIKINNESSIQILKEIGIDIDEFIFEEHSKIRTFISFEDFEKLKLSGFQYEVIIEDWFKHFSERLLLSSKEISQSYIKNQEQYGVEGFNFGSMGGYLTKDEIYSELDEMRLNYPNLVSQKFLIGNSIENREIWGVRISTAPNSDNGKPRIFLNSLTHAREPAGMMALMFYIHYLLDNYASNPEIQFLLNNRQIYFTPLVNPDGYEYNRETNPNGGGMWRKNRRANATGNFGVDINRNFGFQWGYDNVGSSSLTSSNSYRGTAPFSEPETQAIRNFMNNNHFNIALNYHTYGNKYLYSWGYISAYPPDSSTYGEYGYDISKNNKYTYGPSSVVLYKVNGGANDWMYGEQIEKPKVIAITPEVGNSADNFWPTQDRILPLAYENLQPNLYMTWATGEFPKYLEGNFSKPYVVPGDTIMFYPTIRNKGLVDAQNISAVLTSVSSSVGFVQNELQIQSIQSQNNYVSTQPYILFLNTNTQSGERLDLVISYYKSGIYMRSDTVALVRAITTVASGNWSDSTTWFDNDIPSKYEDVFISAGNTVTINGEVSCRNLTFSDAQAKIDLSSSSSLLSVYGDFKIASTSHNAFSNWTAGAKLAFQGDAPVQKIIGLGTSSTVYSTIFSNLVVDKSFGRLTTGNNDGIGANTKLFIGNSLEIIRGTFELATTDDIEGRLTSGTASSPTITVRQSGILDVLGSSSHIRRGNFIGAETSKIGLLTVYGIVNFGSGTTNRINFSGISIENGGYVVFLTNRGTLASSFNPGVVMIKNGGVFKNNLTTAYWYTNTETPNEMNIDSGGEFFTASGTTQLPQVININGNIRFGGSDQTIPANLPPIEGTLYLSNSGVKTLAGNVTVNGRLLLYSSASLNIGANALIYGANAILQYGDQEQSFSQLTTNNEFPLLGGPNNVVIYNQEGVTLHAAREVNGSLTITEGFLDTGEHSILLGASAQLFESESGALIGKITSDRTVSQGVNNQFGGIGLELNATGTSPGVTTVERVTGFAFSGNGHETVKRYFKVNPTINNNLNATVVFHYRTDELNGINESKLVALKSTDNGVNWIDIPGTVDQLNKTVTVNGVNQMSWWTLANQDSLIPVELISFSAISEKEVVTLNWSTATETNNKGFEIERKTEEEWKTITFITGKGTTTESQEYIYKDKVEAFGKYTYRLRQIDLDGTVSYSKEVEVEAGVVPREFSLSQNYPNPFNPETTIEFTLSEGGMTELKVYNVIGKEVATLYKKEGKAGELYRIKFDGKLLPSGIYFAKLSQGNNQTIKKMILMK